MIDYWEKLPSKIKGSKKRRFNYIMSKINQDDENNEGNNVGVEGQSDNNNTNNTPSSSLEKYNISFSIKDDEGDGVGSATVTVDGISKNTGSAGGCSFPDITEGNKTVTVIAEGYEEYTETINIDANNTTFNITLTTTE